MKPAIFERNINLLEAQLGDELVALDPTAGYCFGFNEVATRVWGLLETPRTFDELCAALMEEYEVTSDQCALDLRHLLDDLTGKALIKSTKAVAR